MELQYKLENVPEVERAFVHVDYKKRLYDEHINSKRYKTYENQKSADLEVERAASPEPRGGSSPTPSTTSSGASGYEIL